MHSRIRSVREELASVLGSEIVRCSTCQRRFVCFLRFSIPTSNYDGYSKTGDSFRVVWFSIFGGLLTLESHSGHFAAFTDGGSSLGSRERAAPGPIFGVMLHPGRREPAPLTIPLREAFQCNDCFVNLIPLLA